MAEISLIFGFKVNLDVSEKAENIQKIPSIYPKLMVGNTIKKSDESSILTPLPVCNILCSKEIRLLAACICVIIEYHKFLNKRLINNDINNLRMITSFLIIIIIIINSLSIYKLLRNIPAKEDNQLKCC